MFPVIAGPQIALELTMNCNSAGLPPQKGSPMMTASYDAKSAVDIALHWVVLTTMVDAFSDWA